MEFGKQLHRLNSRRMNYQIYRGFSLLELLVVLAIVAIITATALPLYGRYQQLSWRTLAQTELLRIANELESEYTHLGYANFSRQQFPKNNSKYTLRMEKNGNHAFTIIAEPLGTQQSDGALAVYSDGRRHHYTNPIASGSFTVW